MKTNDEAHFPDVDEEGNTVPGPNTETYLTAQAEAAEKEREAEARREAELQASGFVAAEVEEMAALAFTAAEVCTINGFDFARLEHNPEFNQAMLRGRLREQAVIRATVFAHAKNGSAPAQALALELISRAEVAAAGN